MMNRKVNEGEANGTPKTTLITKDVTPRTAKRRINFATEFLEDSIKNGKKVTGKELISVPGAKELFQSNEAFVSTTAITSFLNKLRTEMSMNMGESRCAFMAKFEADGPAQKKRKQEPPTPSAITQNIPLVSEMFTFQSSFDGHLYDCVCVLMPTIGGYTIKPDVKESGACATFTYTSKFQDLKCYVESEVFVGAYLNFMRENHKPHQYVVSVDLLFECSTDVEFVKFMDPYSTESVKATKMVGAILKKKANHILELEF